MNIFRVELYEITTKDIIRRKIEAQNGTEAMRLAKLRYPLYRVNSVVESKKYTVECEKIDTTIEKEGK